MKHTIRRPFNKFAAVGVVLAFLLLFLAQSHVAYAATISVNTTDDELNADGDCSLREAIQAANTDTAVDACTAGSGADTIVVPAGTYTLSIAGRGDNANASGDLDITEELILSGNGQAETIIQAGTDETNGIDRVFHVFAEATFENVIIRHGQATGQTGGEGGGIHNRGTVNLTNSSVSGNSTDTEGGGIYNYDLGTMTLTNSTVSNNSNDSNGGGITNNGTMTLTNSTIRDNSSWDAGGIYNNGTVTLTNSTVSGNSARQGGIYNRGMVTLINSTVSGNSVDGIINNYGTVTLTNSTVSGNFGSGIYNNYGSGTVTLTNTIIANQLAGADCAGFSNTSLGHNLDSDGSCNLTNPNDKPNNPNANLGPLQLNAPGNTETHALLPGSDAIDAGNDAVCNADPVNGLDQRDVARPQPAGGHCDIGAYELEPPQNNPPILTVDNDPVTVDEGDMATNSGSVGDPDGAPVTLSASLGSVVNNGNGTWSWNFTPGDGPAESQTVTIFADDGKGGTSQTTFELEVNNVPPTANAGSDQTVYRNDVISLSGMWTDPAGSLDDPYLWEWDKTGDGIVDSSSIASYGSVVAETTTFATEGTYTLTFHVTDKDNGVGSDSLVVNVLNRPPDCSAAAPSVSVVWPPNHQFVPVNVLGVSDPEGDLVSVTIASIRQDEPVDTQGDGQFVPDGQGVGTATAEVRAERVGTKKEPGNGRIYYIGFTADDGHSGSCSGEVLVGVPHDQNSVPIGDGAAYNSTVP